jgi:hypothetical protein
MGSIGPSPSIFSNCFSKKAFTYKIISNHCFVLALVINILIIPVVIMTGIDLRLVVIEQVLFFGLAIAVFVFYSNTETVKVGDDAIIVDVF